MPEYKINISREKRFLGLEEEEQNPNSAFLPGGKRHKSFSTNKMLFVTAEVLKLLISQSQEYR